MRTAPPTGKLSGVRFRRIAAFFHYVRIGRWHVAWEILRGERQRGGTRSG
jgi:hypothetical protein